MADPHNADPHNLPLSTAVICCTGLPPDHRSQIAYKSSEMGARTALDLTSDVTHLICTSLFSQKYNYVARMRSDVKVLSTAFIDRMYASWLRGDDIDVPAFERDLKFPIFYNLAISVTGIPDVAERKRIEEIVVNEGGTYHPDLTRQCSHLLAVAPTGKKWEFARVHEMQCVLPKWFWDSVERGMALEERFYALDMDPEMVGVGARPEGKVEREMGEVRGQGKRRIRKKREEALGSQGAGLWDEIRGYASGSRKVVRDAWEEGGTVEEEQEEEETQSEVVKEVVKGLFWDACFLLRGFTKKQELLLIDVLAGADGNIAPSPEKLTESKKSVKYILYPRVMPRPDYTVVLPGVEVVTEWWVEDCVFHKQLLDVQSDNITTMPFEQIPIPELEGLSISITQIYQTEFLHWKKLIPLMGAVFHDTLTKKVDLLITSGAPKGPKFSYAVTNAIPVVSTAWFVASIKARKKLPYTPYLITTAPPAPEPASPQQQPKPLLGDRFAKRKPPPTSPLDAADPKRPRQHNTPSPDDNADATKRSRTSSPPTSPPAPNDLPPPPLPAPKPPVTRTTSDITHLHPPHHSIHHLPTSTQPAPQSAAASLLSRYETADFSTVIAAEGGGRARPKQKKLRGMGRGVQGAEQAERAEGEVQSQVPLEASQRVVYLDEEAEMERGRVAQVLGTEKRSPKVVRKGVGAVDEGEVVRRGARRRG